MPRFLWSDYSKMGVVLFKFHRWDIEHRKIYDWLPLKITSIENFLKETEHLRTDPFVDIPFEIDFDIPDWL